MEELLCQALPKHLCPARAPKSGLRRLCIPHLRKQAHWSELHKATQLVKGWAEFKIKCYPWLHIGNIWRALTTLERLTLLVWGVV
jgi:hypothetical protein